MTKADLQHRVTCLEETTNVYLDILHKLTHDKIRVYKRPKKKIKEDIAIFFADVVNVESIEARTLIFTGTLKPKKQVKFTV